MDEDAFPFSDVSSGVLFQKIPCVQVTTPRGKVSSPRFEFNLQHLIEQAGTVRSFVPQFSHCSDNCYEDFRMLHSKLRRYCSLVFCLEIGEKEHERTEGEVFDDGPNGQ